MDTLDEWLSAAPMSDLQIFDAIQEVPQGVPPQDPGRAGNGAAPAENSTSKAGTNCIVVVTRQMEVGSSSSAPIELNATTIERIRRDYLKSQADGAAEQYHTNIKKEEGRIGAQGGDQMAGDGAVALAAGCTIIASAIAIWHIYMHLRNYTEPTYQRYTVRIIFMIHVYALMSFLALVAPSQAIFFNSICGMYEAWVIYNFLSLCLAWVGGPGVVATSLQGRFLKPSWHLMTCCCNAIPLDGIFIRRCKRGVLQFVILKPLLVLASLVLFGSDMYEDGSFSTSDGYLYITIVYTFSYTAALAALVLFYVACKDLLRPFRPLPKFLIIKSVVFLTYWQGVLIALLASAHVVKTAQDATDVQNIVICVEMLFAAVAHLYAFPYTAYAEANVGSQGDLVNSILHALNFSDVVHDTLHQFAPTYHEYVLYSDGSQEAPQRYRTRTFVATGLEMESPRTSKTETSDPDNSASEAGGSPPAETRGEIPDRSPPSYGQLFGQPYDKAPLEAGIAPHRPAYSGRPPVGPGKSYTDNDFNPRALLQTPENRRAALFRLDDPRARGPPPSEGAGGKLAGAGRGTDVRRLSTGEEDSADELTKLTDRRASEHGAFMDTIDIRGENDEYSEGFIQR